MDGGGRKSSRAIYKAIMQKELRVDDYTITVDYKRIKNIYLRVLPPDGRVRISAPLGMPDARLYAFARERRTWIDRQRVSCTLPVRRYETGETIPLWGQELPLTVHAGRGRVSRSAEGLLLFAPAGADEEARVKIIQSFYRAELRRAVEELWEPCMRQSGARANEWRIRDMKTRWGSCNVNERRVWLNLRLAQKPPECLRYVILHELCHLHERGHGKSFWAHMDVCCPDWRTIRKRLNGKDTPCT